MIKLDYPCRMGAEPQAMLFGHLGTSAKTGLHLKLDQGYGGSDNSKETDMGGIGVHWFF